MGDGEVMVNVRTLNPGMVGSGDVYFVLTITMLLPSGSSGRVNELRKDDSSYASGDIVMFNTVLEVDNTYNFSVLVGNEYGMSTTNSITVQITGRNIASNELLLLQAMSLSIYLSHTNTHTRHTTHTHQHTHTTQYTHATHAHARTHLYATHIHHTYHTHITHHTHTHTHTPCIPAIPTSATTVRVVSAGKFPINTR